MDPEIRKDIKDIEEITLAALAAWLRVPQDELPVELVETIIGALVAAYRRGDPHDRPTKPGLIARARQTAFYKKLTK